MQICNILLAAVLFLPSSGCKPGPMTTNSAPAVVDLSVPKKLAVVSPAYLAAEQDSAGQQSHGSAAELARNGTSVAYVEPYDGKFRVVHNGKAGKPYLAISELGISSDGRRVAYVAAVNKDLNRLVVDGREGLAFGADDNHWFTPDGKQHISTVTEGGAKYIVVEGRVIRDYKIARGPELSPDSRSIAFSVESVSGGRKQFVISDLAFRTNTVLESCGEFIFPSDDSSRLAVGCLENGKSSIRVVDFLSRAVVSERAYDGVITHMKFSKDSRSLLYTYQASDNKRYVVWDNREEKITDGDEFFSDPLVLSDPESVGVIIGTVYKARLYRAFQKQKKDDKGYGYISDFVSSNDGRHYAFAAVNHNEAQQYMVVDGHEGIKFDRIVSPAFSPDGRFLVYRAREGGKRFVVVSDLKGKVISRHRDYAMVFQPVFIAGGKSVGYGVLDGNEFWWKVEKL